jgi:uncharacterized protein YecT (DUF1311 family)
VLPRRRDLIDGPARNSAVLGLEGVWACHSAWRGARLAAAADAMRTRKTVLLAIALAVVAAAVVWFSLGRRPAPVPVVIFTVRGYTNVSNAQKGDDPELQRLGAALDAAMTQEDMNIASWNISQYWDAKLGSAEKQVQQKLDDTERKQFAESKERWRKYRAQEVQFRADFFAGGSIQPMMEYGAYTDITVHRVEEMESLLWVELQGRTDAAQGH